MDYNSIHSELIESLDFLRPPVKRNYRNIDRGTSVNINYQNDASRGLTGFSNKISAGTQPSEVKIRGAESSTSLILNKPTEKILEQYSLLSYTNLLYKKRIPKLKRANSPTPKEKPLIKVTVIPKATQTTNVRKRKHLAKKVQTTVSNQESSIHTKNVYLVVPSGHKKDKVYQIKTAGSANFPNRYKQFKDEVIPIKQLSSLKLVLDSLNMERKKDKNKKRRKKPQTDPAYLEPPRISGEAMECCECLCSHEGEIPPDMFGGKSFVRISGRLGLNDEERYVLRCAATVNDKPASTDFTNILPTSLREERRFFNMCDTNMCSTRFYDDGRASPFSQKRDCNIQTDLQNGNTSQIPTMKPNLMCNKQTQATQVDFNTGRSSEVEKCTDLFSYRNEIVQCPCENIESRASPSNSDSDVNSVKGCQSPLVIISVYPMPDCMDNNVTVMENDNRISSGRKTIVCNQTVKQRPFSGNCNVKEKCNDNKVVRPINRSASPNRNQNRNLNKTNTIEPKMLRSRRPSPDRVITPMNCRQTRTSKERNGNRPSFNRESTGERSPQRNTSLIKDTKGTNTDHNITKKILVDNYTKKLTAYMENNVEKKIRFPKKDVSKVTVDIDGDKEHYDVIFQQDDVTTDLKVKKTLKEAQNRNSDDFMNIFPPMNKLRVMPDESRKKSQMGRNQQLNDGTMQLKSTFSRLHVRDSIEISHSHDIKTGKIANGKRTSKTNDDSSEPFSAPIKHYRGDNCSITDPIQRDKEIRSLLGVDKGVNASMAQDYKVDKKKYTVPLHYFYNKTCEKKIVTGINLVEVPIPPCVCCDIRKKYYGGSGSYHSRQIVPQSPVAPTETTHNIPVPSKSQHHEIVDSTDTPSPAEDNVSDVKVNKSKSREKSMGNNTGTQYETQVQRTSLYQQLILNRNIQVFLQVEQFSKQRPIVLSRKQYDKVKRTIENTIANKGGREYKRKKCICRTSLVSVGDVRKKTKHDHEDSQYRADRNDKKDLGVVVKRSSSMSQKSVRIKERPCACEVHNKQSTLVLFSKETRAESKRVVPPPVPVAPRKTVSSLEFRYASMSYMKHVTFSSTNVEVGSNTAALQQKESHSIHTIFKGHKKPHTPNLGTSMFSLCSEELKPEMPLAPQEPKKKPFLRRLMSCLVMRSTRVSQTNNMLSPSPKIPSVESSIDSYHISTSLGEIEVTSSIYDTSASFYTNHSVYPINSKMKRGFFSSVREFLTSRKS